MLPVHGNIVWRVRRNRDVLHLQLLMALTREELKTCFAIPQKTTTKKKRFKVALFFFSFFFSFLAFLKNILILRKNLFMCINVKTGAKRREIREQVEIMKNGLKCIEIDTNSHSHVSVM